MAQERFHEAALVAVNFANWLTRMWKYAPGVIGESEYMIHASLFSMIEANKDIFAAGNCHDAMQYKEYSLFCPFAYRLSEGPGTPEKGPLLAKDLAIEYKYLANTSEWFYIARKTAEEVIKNGTALNTGREALNTNYFTKVSGVVFLLVLRLSTFHNFHILV